MADDFNAGVRAALEAVEPILRPMDGCNAFDQAYAAILGLLRPDVHAVPVSNEATVPAWQDAMNKIKHESSKDAGDLQIIFDLARETLRNHRRAAIVDQ